MRAEIAGNQTIQLVAENPAEWMALTFWLKAYVNGDAELHIDEEASDD